MNKKIILLFFLLSTLISAAQTTEEIGGIVYDIVNITVSAPDYDPTKSPVFAKVKYNKLCPLVITSDDMGISELVNNWAYFNGYPTFDSKTYAHVLEYISTGDDFMDCPYNTIEWHQQNKNLKRDGHQPLTYTDDAGGIRRFTATSAIWPSDINNTNYMLMDGTDAKTMIRMGWSFAQHDVDKGYTSTAQDIADRFATLSGTWEQQVGIGLKVMVEPNGNHLYVDAGKLSDGICWNIFQNGDSNHPGMNPVAIDDWTTGTDWTSFDSKPDATTIRFFFQDKEAEFENTIGNADGSAILMGGTHGISERFLRYLKETIQPSDKYWVAGADEVWEYYHLYNNARITDISYTNGKLSFNVKVPRYKKNQFRELTINIPGITNGTTHTFSNNVITGNGRQNTDYYTLNIGLEDKILTYIDELTTYYRSHQHNEYVKDDAQYLINLLTPGSNKTNKQAALDAAPTYCTYEVKASIDGKILASGAQDAATEVTYTFPKYLLSGTDLYEATKNAAEPYYVTTFTPNSGTDNRTITYTKSLEDIIFYSEGEELEGALYNPTNPNKITDKNQAEYYVYRAASNAAGGIIQNQVTLLTLEPGRYKLTAAAAASNTKESNNTTYLFKLGGNTIFTFTSNTKNTTEYVKDEIIVKESQSLTLEAENPNITRWLDYLFIQKTGDYDVNSPVVTLTSPSDTYDATSNVPEITVTATSTPKVNEANIIQTVIRNEVGDIVAQNDGNTCTYTFTPTRLGEYQFVAESTDDSNRTGISDRITITVTTDFTFSARNNLGDDICQINLTDQGEDKTITYLYPRYVLKGTNLYETTARSVNGQPKYGESLTLSLSSNDVERTIDYEKATPNIVFYKEGENISGTTTVTQSFGGNVTAEYYALMLGSNGAAARFSSVDVTTLPAGRYKLYAGIGKTATSQVGNITFSFKLDGTAFYEYIAPSYPNIFDITQEFEVTADESTLSISISNNGVKDWLDYIYIQKLDPISITVTNTGYATFSSKYALDFTNTDIKAYVAEDQGDKVLLTRFNGTVPANTGLILEGKAGDETVEDIPLATSIPDDIGNNALMPHVEGGIVAAGNYVFSKENTSGELAFRRLTKDTNVPAGRSYLTASLSTARLQIIFDETTSVQPSIIETTQAYTKAYDLKGINAPRSLYGIILKNGKKHINKH